MERLDSPCCSNDDRWDHYHYKYKRGCECEIGILSTAEVVEKNRRSDELRARQREGTRPQQQRRNEFTLGVHHGRHR